MPGRTTAGANTLEKFTGKERDTEANLNLDYFGARYYDPATGRLWSPDPILGERSPLELLETDPRLLSTTTYGYVFGNPINLVDPDGRMPQCPDCDFLDSFKYALSRDFTYLGDLFRADQQGQLEQKISQDLTDAGNAAVDAGAEFADKASDASTIAAAGGIVAAPFIGGSSLALTGYALSAGAVADATSLGLKTVDYAAFDGTSEAVFDQGVTMILRGGSGALVKSLSSKMVVRAGARVTGPAFRSASTGRFVTNRFGQTVTAATDATRVGLNAVIPAQGYYNFLLNKKN